MLETFQASASDRKGGCEVTFALVIAWTNDEARRRHCGINWKQLKKTWRRAEEEAGRQRQKKLLCVWLLERKRARSDAKRSFYRGGEPPGSTTSFRASPNRKSAQPIDACSQEPANNLQDLRNIRMGFSYEYSSNSFHAAIQIILIRDLTGGVDFVG